MGILAADLSAAFFMQTGGPLPLAELTGGAMSMAWGLLLFFIILGAMLTLAPSKRTTEIKRSKDD